MIQFTYLPELLWLIGAGVLAGALIYLSYHWSKRKSKRWLKVGLTAWRWLIVSAVFICLLDPEWVEAIKHQPKARVAVLVDTSRSMSIKDVPQGRLNFAKSWLQKNIRPAVPQNVIMEYYSFSDALAPLVSIDSAEAKGDTTALADALEGLLAIPREDPLAGAIVCSDGIENAQRDPEAVAKLYHRKGVPIHAVTVGTTNDMQDIVIENVQVKRAVPNQSPTKIGISLRSFGYREQSVPVQIFRGNQIVASQRVKLKDGPQKIELDFTPRQKGFQTYEVKIPAQNREWLVTNNRRMFGLEVVDPTIRVIYMEGTPQHPNSSIPEWKYLQDALESDPNIKVKTLYRQFGANGQMLNTVDVDPQSGTRIYPVEHPTQGFPRSLAELMNYDVIIHSDIKKESFTPDQLMNMARLVEEFGGGFVMIGGNSAFGKGGYHRTILDRIIPVAMQQENDSQARAFRMQVPQVALAHPIIAFGATRAETELIWNRKFPPLYGCNLVDRAKPGAIVLGEDPVARNTYGPRLILAVQNIGKGRSMAFTSDTTRTWGKDFETLWGEPINPALPVSEQNCDSRYYRQFWVNAVRWLAAGRIGRTNNPVTLELAQSYCAPGEKVAASIKVRDKEQREVSTADVFVLLSGAGKTNPPVRARFDRTSQSYLADLSPIDACELMVTAVAATKNVRIGDDRQLLVCEGGDKEMADLRARPDLMSKIARASGGKSFSTSDKDAHAGSEIFSSAPPVTVEYRRTPLWDKSWWLGTILGLLTVEWVVRRLSGLA